MKKKGKRKVQAVPQSQTAALPRPQEEEETDKSKQAQPNKRTKSTKISYLFPKRGNRNTKRTEKHKNKMTHGKTYNKSPRRINLKATKSKTNTGTTALERSVEQTTGEFKALLQLANFTLGSDATLNTEKHKNSVRIKAPNSVNASKNIITFFSSLKDLPCVILFLCFSFLLVLRLPHLALGWGAGEGGERANLGAFRTFVRFVLVWICRFPLPLSISEGLRFVIVALPGLFSYLFFFFLTM